MNIEEIRAAVDAGKTVHWKNTGYVVHKDRLGQYLITFQQNGHTIGLTDQSGTQLNGAPDAFFVAPPTPDPDVTMHCRTCGGRNVKRDAWAEWNAEQQVWEATDLFDHAFCNDCDGTTKIVDRPIFAATGTPELEATS